MFVPWSPNIHHTVSFDGVLEVIKALEEVRVGKVVMTIWTFVLLCQEWCPGYKPT